MDGSLEQWQGALQQILEWGSLSVLAIIPAGLVIYAIVIRWILFVKADESGWCALIPFYSDYKMYCVAWEPRYFWQTLIIPAVMGAIISLVIFQELTLYVMIAEIILLLWIRIIQIVHSFKLAKSFSLHWAFGFLGLISPLIIESIIVFSKNSVYEGSM